MAAAPPQQFPQTPPAEFASEAFDYLVVGGGTAGLVVAARLSADPSIRVGVLEAGPAVLDDALINVPGKYGQSLGGRFDWQFETVAQPGLAGRSLPWPRGKIVGGTSALNFMTWNRASRQDYDAWRDLGNAGWGWDDMLFRLPQRTARLTGITLASPFFKRSETFHAPDGQNQQQNKLFYDAESVGKTGPVQIGYATEYSASHRLWHDTLHALGADTNEAHVAGSNVGVWTNLGSVDPESMTRSYSATAYYVPNANRLNLRLLTDAIVTEIVLDEDNGGDDGQWTATGVRFRHGDELFTVSAAKEVIVCAGSVQSPQILELSGIGNADILERAGVPVKVNNPNVGENLQDHIMAAMIFEVDPSLPNPDDLKHSAEAAAAAQESYASSKTGPLTVLPNSISYLPLSHCIPAAALESISAAAANLDAFHAQDRAIRRGRLDPGTKLGQIEYIFDLGNWSAHFQPDPSDGKKYGTCLQILQYPFSKGSIHIPAAAAREDGQRQPPSVLDKPVIDPHYYDGAHGALDREAMTHCAAFVDKLSQTAPLSSVIRGRVFPPPFAEGADPEAAFRQWIVDTTITDWHPVGTCAMGGSLGREAGVVDARLRVYGVRGLRVVDASVMPLQISAHLQATVYAIAEKGAQMILEDAGKSGL